MLPLVVSLKQNLNRSILNDLRPASEPIFVGIYRLQDSFPRGQKGAEDEREVDAVLDEDHEVPGRFDCVASNGVFSDKDLCEECGHNYYEVSEELAQTVDPKDIKGRVVRNSEGGKITELSSGKAAIE